jgi:hypothetical protein
LPEQSGRFELCGQAIRQAGSRQDRSGRCASA